MNPQREALPAQDNPLGLLGIEFIEYSSSQPQALGRILEALGFRPVARHRSREVTLYRQGPMNLVVNAHADEARGGAKQHPPEISAVALAVRDARLAHLQCLELGAWDIPCRAQAMELNIPGIRGPGGAQFLFVDRPRGLSIFDVDFVPIPTVDPQPAAVAGQDYFGVVQYIGLDRTAEWMNFFERLLGFREIPDGQRFGVMPAGRLMASPCNSFMWQLIEPASPDADDGRERLQRVGIASVNVPASVTTLRERGVQFVDAAELHPQSRGALTRTQLGTVSFELVHRTA